MAVNDKGDPRKQSVSLALTAAVAGTPAVQAQEQATLDEITVTATKREATMQAVPVTITAFSEEEINLQRFKNFADYVGQIPSLAVSDRQPGAQSVVMRGCAAQGLSFSDSSTTSVYLDEQPITAAGYNPDPRLIDVARVEALAGPQGTLFGDAAQCGTLRIITNKPDTAGVSAWIDLTGSTVTDGGNGFDIAAMANVPLVEDRLALRLVGFYADEPGWVDNILSPTPGRTSNNADRVRSDVNSSIWSGVRSMLRWTPSEDWTIDLAGIYQNYELDGYGDVDRNIIHFQDTSVFPTFGEREQARFAQETWEDEWYQTSLTVEGELGFGNVVLTGAYFSRDSAYFADATAYQQSFQQRGDYFRSFNTGNPYYDTGGIYDFGGDPLGQVFDERDTTVWSVEGRYSTPAEGRWSAIVGGFYSHREVNELFISNTLRNFPATQAFYYLNTVGYYYYQVAPKATSTNWFSGFYDSELDQWAIFGEVAVDVTPNFTITAGGRYYDIENKYLVQNATLVGLNGGIPNCGNSGAGGTDYCYGINERSIASETGFVPKVNLTYRWDERMIYATYSEGFRRGGANSARPQSVFGAPGRFPAPAGSLNAYTSDTVKNVEFGAKTDWLENTLRLNVAIYRMTWDDIQIQAEDPQDDVFALGIVNFPQAEIDGVEFWFNWLPADSWSVDATVGYNNGELSKTATLFPGTAAALIAPKGTPLPIVPDWKGHLNLTYTIPATWFGGEPYVLARYAYTGESVNSLAGIEASEFNSPVVKQAAYSTVDLQLGVDTANWSASLFVDNLTDENAELFFNNRYNQQRLSRNRPRTIGINFRYRYGDTN